MTDTHHLPRLRSLPIEQRLDAIARAVGLSDADVAAARAGLSLEQAGHMIENVVATYALPLGIAENFRVNGRDVLVPMVVEEASVVAACGYAAKLARARGGFTASSSDPIMIGQIQTLDVPDLEAALARIAAEAPALVAWLNTGNPSTRSTHARAVGIEGRVIAADVETQYLASLRPSQSAMDTQNIASLRRIDDMLIVHVLYDCGDAMGANLINTACEALAPRIEALSGGRVNLRILSNYSTKRMASARCEIPVAALSEDAAEATAAAERIVEASIFAETDPYRAVTHNKGVMNGIDAVLMATGNDWRAVEAAAHAWAARDGHYGSMTRWRLNATGDALVGEIELPMAVGTVGGATRSHPSAQVALKILGLTGARALAEVIVCVGLAQNFGAIRALAMEGIQRGHMGLHARQVAIAAGATGAQIERIAAQMVSEGNVRAARARELVGGAGGG
jgi:hydroxymethylglutaryl-CoA reductase